MFFRTAINSRSEELVLLLLSYKNFEDLHETCGIDHDDCLQNLKMFQVLLKIYNEGSRTIARDLWFAARKKVLLEKLEANFAQ